MEATHTREVIIKRIPLDELPIERQIGWRELVGKLVGRILEKHAERRASENAAAPGTPETLIEAPAGLCGCARHREPLNLEEPGVVSAGGRAFCSRACAGWCLNHHQGLCWPK